MRCDYIIFVHISVRWSFRFCWKQFLFFPATLVCSRGRSFLWLSSLLAELWVDSSFALLLLQLYLFILILVAYHWSPLTSGALRPVHHINPHGRSSCLRHTICHIRGHHSRSNIWAVEIILILTAKPIDCLRLDQSLVCILKRHLARLMHDFALGLTWCRSIQKCRLVESWFWCHVERAHRARRPGDEAPSFLAFVY